MCGRKARFFILHRKEDQVCCHQEYRENKREATPTTLTLTHTQTWDQKKKAEEKNTWKTGGIAGTMTHGGVMVRLVIWCNSMQPELEYYMLQDRSSHEFICILLPFIWFFWYVFCSEMSSISSSPTLLWEWEMGCALPVNTTLPTSEYHGTVIKAVGQTEHKQYAHI